MHSLQYFLLKRRHGFNEVKGSRSPQCFQVSNVSWAYPGKPSVGLYIFIQTLALDSHGL